MKSYSERPYCSGWDIYTEWITIESHDKHCCGSLQSESLEDQESSGLTHCQRTCKIPRWHGMTSERRSHSRRSQMYPLTAEELCRLNVLLHVVWLRSKARNITYRNGTKQSVSEYRYFCTDFFYWSTLYDRSPRPGYGHVPSNVLTFSPKRRAARLMRAPCSAAQKRLIQPEWQWKGKKASMAPVRRQLPC